MRIRRSQDTVHYLIFVRPHHERNSPQKKKISGAVGQIIAIVYSKTLITYFLNISFSTNSHKICPTKICAS